MSWRRNCPGETEKERLLLCYQISHQVNLPFLSSANYLRKIRNYPGDLAFIGQIIFLIDFKEIDETYLQIVAGRFPLNKELAFELAALMAQVSSFDHLHFLNTSNFQNNVVELVFTNHHLLRLTWVTWDPSELAAAPPWQMQISRTLSPGSQP